MFIIVLASVLLAIFSFVLSGKSLAIQTIDPNSFQDLPPAPPPPDPPPPPPPGDPDPDPEPPPESPPDTPPPDNPDPGSSDPSEEDPGNTSGEAGVPDPELCERYSKIELKPESSKVEINSSIQFIATVYDVDGNPMEGFTFAFSTEKGNIDSSGLHTASTTEANYLVSVSSGCDATASASVETIDADDENESDEKCDSYFDCLIKNGDLGKINGIGELNVSDLSKVSAILFGASAVAVLGLMALGNLISSVSVGEALYGIVLSGIGKRKRTKTFGLILDKKNKLPIRFALIQLISRDRGRIIDRQISNKFGQYGFVADAGNYQMLVKKKGYKEIIVNAPIDTKSNTEGVITADIYLEPIKEGAPSPKIIQFLDFLQKALKVLNWLIIISGTIFSALAYYVHPVKINLIILAVYIPLWMYHIYQSFGRKSFGVVTYGQTTIDLAIIRIFDNRKNSLKKTTVSNSKGHYSAMLPKGEYKIYGSKGDLRTREPEILEIKKGIAPTDKNLKLS